MKNLFNRIICAIVGHRYTVTETFKRIGTNEYYKVYRCSRCGKIFHEVTTKINS